MRLPIGECALLLDHAARSRLWRDERSPSPCSETRLRPSGNLITAGECHPEPTQKGDSPALSGRLDELVAALVTAGLLVWFSAKTESSSYATWAAAIPVISAWSYGGETSTMSAPTTLTPTRARSVCNSSRLVSPPASGVPVPGAWAGSRTSMSTET